MPKLHFVFPDGAEARFALEGDTFTIGRAEDNDMVIQDPRVSAHHLILKRSQSGNFIINDLGSTNPTRVNGRAATLAELSDGDTLLLGDTFARYEAPPHPTTAPSRHSRASSDHAPTAGGCFAVLLASASLLGILITTAKTLW